MQKAYRLPHNIYPRQYTVSLDARLGVETFDGQVSIQVDIVSSGTTIALHAQELRIGAATLTMGADRWAAQVSYDSQLDQDVVVLTFTNPYPRGSGLLELSFSGHINRGLQGLYLAQDGPEQVLCTQCEATYARAIFPCFDEPEFKARFAWRITTNPGATVLANGPLREVVTATDGASQTWIFEATKPMSTYLVALVIGDIACAETRVVAGTPLRVWAMRGKEALGRFALDYTERLLVWYEDYFGVPYHFAKYDQVAVPGFAAGAMENSGLVLFRQSLLLMDPLTTSLQEEKQVAHVVAHEFAHMWFGNLVTMRWWDDLWLNEAFAEWMAYAVVNSLNPDYDIWSDFQHDKDRVMATDALNSTHPIYSPVQTAAEAEELFDNITYAKGCAVVSMLENYLGTETFRAGLRVYMRDYAEANATGPDFWQRLQQVSEQPIVDLMESWVTQAGYPLVRLAYERTGRMRISQRRFFSSPLSRPAEQRDDQFWTVPLVIRYEDADGVHETRYLLTTQEESATLDVRGSLLWLYANVNESGYYRQHLMGDLLPRLMNALDRLTPREQVGLLGDQWALVRSGEQSIQRFLDVLSSVSAVENYQVVGAVVGYLHTLNELLEQDGDAAALQRFREWVRSTYIQRHSTLGFVPLATDSLSDTQARPLVIEAMAHLAHDPATIATVAEWAAREASDPSAVDPNLATTFVELAAVFGDVARYDEFLSTYINRRASGASPQETDRYLDSLAEFRPADLVSRTLALLANGTLPKESIGPVLRQMLRLPHAQVAAWTYLKKHWATISAMPMWIPALVATTGHLPAELREDLVDFYEVHLEGQAQHSYRRALDQMDQWAEFRRRIVPGLLAWFV